MTVVLCHGTFDVLHYGHHCLFKAARRYGTKVVVTVTGDKYVNKGNGRPIFNEYERAEMIRDLRSVDHVEIIRERSGVKAIQIYKPRYYVKGVDYLSHDKHGNLERERQALEAVGGELIFIETPQWSSTDLITRISKWKEANEARPRAIVARR